jgi:hypothetical protein
MEAVSTFETSVSFYQTTRRNSHLQTYFFTHHAARKEHSTYSYWDENQYITQDRTISGLSPYVVTRKVVRQQQIVDFHESDLAIDDRLTDSDTVACKGTGVEVGYIY